MCNCTLIGVRHLYTNSNRGATEHKSPTHTHTHPLRLCVGLALTVESENSNRPSFAASTNFLVGIVPSSFGLNDDSDSGVPGGMTRMHAHAHNTHTHIHTH